MLQLVAPKSLRKAILQYLYNHKTGGHLGLTKTLYNVRQRFYWPGQHSDVALWCHRCQECGARKPKKGKRAPLKQETVGPLPQSNSDICISWSLVTILANILNIYILTGPYGSNGSQGGHGTVDLQIWSTKNNL